MLDKILGKKDKDKDVPDLRKDGKKSDSDIGGRLKGMVSKATEKSKEKVNGDKDGGKRPSGGRLLGQCQNRAQNRALHQKTSLL
ncbi:hypothetical protein [Methanobacterium petrolearium]|uniref:hypothetical protein n=1 Tax=Methanobacterium petrolearium TaxID=710190 RepID=UPI0030812147|nr:hypothetical protein GCM10025861_09130 [Methanobacterium petrolearium]